LDSSAVGIAQLAHAVGESICAVKGGDALFSNDFGEDCIDSKSNALSIINQLQIARVVVWRVRLASFRTTASGVRVRIVLVVRRRTATVCRVMVGLGF